MLRLLQLLLRKIQWLIDAQAAVVVIAVVVAVVVVVVVEFCVHWQHW